MSEKELKRLNELRNEIMLVGEIYNDKLWKNYKEYHKLNRLFKLKKTHDVYVDNYNITINQTPHIEKGA